MERTLARLLSGLPMAALLIISAVLGTPAQAGTGSAPNAQGEATVGIATGGGTVDIVSPFIGSFGVNAKRPANFTGVGEAVGRINFDKHGNVLGGRHVNVPVTLMQITISGTPSPNGTGGSANIVGDCQAQGAECPSSTPAYKSVYVTVNDVSDSGANQDSFTIFYCTDPATSFPVNCPGGPDGGALRTGNIQIRPNSGGSGGMAPTAPLAQRRLP
jgi:hypothetical protein